MNGVRQAAETPASAFRIAKAAQATGATPRALRYYEEIGLLSPDRPSGQARVYDATELQRARDIVQLRRLGFSVDEIAAYLDCPSADASVRIHVLDRLNERLRLIADEQVFLQSAITKLATRPGPTPR